ncbi:MAG: hypothetical protein KGQ32_06360, partial [Xanthomonadaceae bacterium]|nr:hypothetical protein [Xanthomonadaceae bacterium]
MPWFRALPAARVAFLPGETTRAGRPHDFGEAAASHSHLANNKNGPQGPAWKVRPGMAALVSGRLIDAGAREKFRSAAIMDDRKHMVAATTSKPAQVIELQYFHKAL